MSENAIDVTVVLPCYNVEKTVEQAVRSAEQNDRIALEILAVNDGSKDGTLALLEQLAAEDPRVRVIDKPNAGYGAGVNRGFAEARGTYLAILEPDDWVEPHMYDDLYELADSYRGKHPRDRYVTIEPRASKTDVATRPSADLPDIVKSSYWRIWMPMTPKERRLHCSYYRRICPDSQPFRLVDCPRLIQHHPSIWSALYRRDFLADKGIRFKEVPGAGWVDNPFLIETMCQADSIVYTDQPYYNYREDLPGSSSANRVLGLSFERWNDMCDVMDRLGVTDRGVRRALTTIGFRYVGEAVARGALDDPELKEQMAQIFTRMDPRDIARINETSVVSPQLINLSNELTGRSVPVSHLAYRHALARELVYTVRNNGVRYALERTGVYGVRSRKQRDNADPTKEHSGDVPSGV